jgi:hypothetical protein
LFPEQVPDPGLAIIQWHAGMIERHATLDPRIDLTHERDKILDRAKMDVWRFIPGARQIARQRHVPAEGHLEPDAPMAEIRKRHNRVAPDPQHLFKHFARLACRLQCLGENYIVEGFVGIAGKIRVGIPLNDRKPLGDAVVDTALGKLNAACVYLFLFGEQPQQRAIATSYIENPASWLNHIRDEQQIDARRNRMSSLGIVSTRLCRHDSNRPAFGWRDAPRPRRCIEKPTRGRDELRGVQQKRVMATIGLDIDKGNRGAARV